MRSKSATAFSSASKRGSPVRPGGPIRGAKVVVDVQQALHVLACVQDRKKARREVGLLVTQPQKSRLSSTASMNGATSEAAGRKGISERRPVTAVPRARRPPPPPAHREERWCGTELIRSAAHVREAGAWSTKPALLTPNSRSGRSRRVQSALRAPGMRKDRDRSSAGSRERTDLCPWVERFPPGRTASRGVAHSRPSGWK